MYRNAYVSWLAMPEPLLFEREILGTLDLPRNLDKNEHNVFDTILRASMADVARRARCLPVLPNPGLEGTHFDPLLTDDPGPNL